MVVQTTTSLPERLYRGCRCPNTPVAVNCTVWPAMMVLGLETDTETSVAEGEGVLDSLELGLTGDEPLQAVVVAIKPTHATAPTTNHPLQKKWTRHGAIVH